LRTVAVTKTTSRKLNSGMVKNSDLFLASTHSGSFFSFISHIESPSISPYTSGNRKGVDTPAVFFLKTAWI